MSMFVEHYQYSWGDQDRPEHFGYYLSCWDRSAEEAPFSSRLARMAYEDAVEAYTFAHGIAADSFTLAACMTIIRDGEEDERAFARDVLSHEEIEVDDEQEEELEEIVEEYRDYKEQVA